MPRAIDQLSHADRDKLKTDTTKFKDSCLSQHDSRSVDENYNIINDNITNIMETHMPSKQSLLPNKTIDSHILSNECMEKTTSI